MLPTFVIGLREGLEAALIVGIVAAFLKQRQRRDLLRLMWIGVAAAALVCVAVGVGLHVLSADLPQKQQEGLETVVGLIAVTMVTYMVVWMRRHSRDLRRQLEGAADSALESGSGLALVAMAFLAVFREGFETAVFLLAAFNGAKSPAAAGGGALLGVAVALILGYGIYRGGVRVNLSKFFRATGLVLVLVAAGLVVSALHTAHEAGWLNVGQSGTVDLTWLVSPGSVQSSLLTGILGLQPRPVIIELIGWLVYLVPIGVYVAWPPGRTVPHRSIRLIGSAVAAVAVVAGGLLTVLAPGSAGAARDTALTLITSGQSAGGPSGPGRLSVLDVNADALTVRFESSGSATPWTLQRAGTQGVDSRAAEVFTGHATSAPVRLGLTPTLSLREIAALNGGRLPLGSGSVDASSELPVTYAATDTPTVLLDVQTQQVLDLRIVRQTVGAVTFPTGVTATVPVSTSSSARASGEVATAARAALMAGRDADQRHLMLGWAAAAWFLAAVALAGAAVSAWALRRSTRRTGASLPTAKAVNPLQAAATRP